MGVFFCCRFGKAILVHKTWWCRSSLARSLRDVKELNAKVLVLDEYSTNIYELYWYARQTVFAACWVQEVNYISTLRFAYELARTYDRGDASLIHAIWHRLPLLFSLFFAMYSCTETHRVNHLPTYVARCGGRYCCQLMIRVCQDQTSRATRGSGTLTARVFKPPCKG